MILHVQTASEMCNENCHIFQINALIISSVDNDRVNELMMELFLNRK